jgi:hypothetical protein
MTKFESLLFAVKAAVEQERRNYRYQNDSISPDPKGGDDSEEAARDLARVFYQKSMRACVLCPEDETRIYDLESLYQLVKLRLSESEIKKYLADSIDIPVEPGWEQEPLFLKIGEPTKRVSLEQAVSTVLGSITPKESRVIRNLYGLSDADSGVSSGGGRRTFVDVSRILGMSARSVSRSYYRAFRKMRHPSRAMDLWHHFKVIGHRDLYAPEQSLLLDVFDMPHTRGICICGGASAERHG